ncbi:hypothetical protein, partial [Marinimicrobium sp. ARAG 43.8]|uniref:hypothetical protein n=1 Tax=Marinimicrobium sp. ARAG 43.8 TaxID=3418719 RepID=UPI003CF9F4F0
GYNRYSYVHNNPLNATDPSGFSAWTDFRDNFLKPVIQAVVTGVCIPCGAALAAATTLYYGGSVGDAAIAAFSTYAIATVGANIRAPGGPGFGFNLETLGFATLGGITSALRGGRFGHGFVSAGAGALTSGYVQGIENAGVELIASTVIAGSISEATGGKFANGAAYAAFSWAVSQGTQRIANSKNDVRYESLGSSESHLSDVEKATAQMEITLAVEGIERQAFGSADLAAQALHEALSPIAKAWKIEIGAMIHDASPSCFCERVVVSDVTTDFLSGSVDIRPLSEFDRVASYHTHTITNMFSTPDFNKEVGGGIDGYLSTPSGRLLRFDHRAFLDGGLPRTKSNFEKYVSEVK